MIPFFILHPIINASNTFHIVHSMVSFYILYCSLAKHYLSPYLWQSSPNWSSCFHFLSLSQSSKSDAFITEIWSKPCHSCKLTENNIKHPYHSPQYNRWSLASLSSDSFSCYIQEIVDNLNLYRFPTMIFSKSFIVLTLMFRFWSFWVNFYI